MSADVCYSPCECRQVIERGTKRWLTGSTDKQEEKEEEKEFAKADAEKATGAWGYEKWQRDSLSSIVWAGMLIWAGVALLLANLGILSWRIGDNRIEPWSIVLIGAGLFHTG